MHFVTPGGSTLEGLLIVLSPRFPLPWCSWLLKPGVQEFTANSLLRMNDKVVPNGAPSCPAPLACLDASPPSQLSRLELYPFTLCDVRWSVATRLAVQPQEASGWPIAYIGEDQRQVSAHSVQASGATSGGSKGGGVERGWKKKDTREPSKCRQGFCCMKQVARGQGQNCGGGGTGRGKGGPKEMVLLKTRGAGSVRRVQMLHRSALSYSARLTRRA